MPGCREQILYSEKGPFLVQRGHLLSDVCIGNSQETSFHCPLTAHANGNYRGAVRHQASFKSEVLMRLRLAEEFGTGYHNTLFSLVTGHSKLRVSHRDCREFSLAMGL